MEILLHSVFIEPINYITVDFESYRMLETTGHLNILIDGNDKVCAVRRVPVVIEGVELGHIYVAKDEVMALDVVPTWLPGQVGLINLYKEAIDALGE